MKEKKSSNSEAFFDTFVSPVGSLYLIFTGNILKKICFRKPDEFLKKGPAPALILQELRDYFKSGRDDFTQKIAFGKGTDFEKKVWLALREIPYGETRTYKWLAEKIGNPGAFRAVGQALGRNPLPIILPCHRVIESDGSLGGYSAGADIKRRLLDMEYYTRMESSVQHE
jgi:methylated-DNA-[protein]-cysteine S-methyltransferase